MFMDSSLMALEAHRAGEVLVWILTCEHPVTLTPCLVLSCLRQVLWSDYVPPAPKFLC